MATEETTPEVDLLSSIENGKAERRILEFAARGFIPLPPGELVRAVGSILAMGDPELVPLAEETYKTFDHAALISAVASDGIRGEQLDQIARRTEEAKVLEPLIRHRAVPDATLAWLAERIPANLQDILVVNQVRLLAAPVIVEKLFENPNLSTDIRRRADEFVEEFFLKKEREEDARRAIEATLGPQAKPADQKPQEQRTAQDEDEGPPLSEDEKQSLFAKLSTMGIVQKVRLAWRGTKEERMFLVRDRNRLVSTAVLKSPKTREADAETIANMKSVSEDVLRGIAFRKEWMRKPGILRAIVLNPRSPIDITLQLVPKLSQKDQKTLAGDRNVPEGVRATARRIVMAREM